MFDFEYNTNVGFVPRVAVIGAKYGQVEEDIEEMQDELGDLSKNVADNSAAIEENAAAINGNSVAIEENTAAIAENAAAIIDEARIRETEIAAVNERINNIPAFEMKLVEELPEEGEPTIIYLVKDKGKDTCSEYVYVDGKWEKLGSEVDLSDYVKEEDLEAAIAPLAVQENVYTKAEADVKFLTEHQDLSDIESDIESLSGTVKNTQSEVEILSGSVEDLSENVSYEFESVDTKLAGLAEVNAVQNEKISAVTADYKKLKDIVGDMGGDVEYLVPGDGKLTDVLKKSGTVKLSEDTQSATYTGGITSKNVTTLHLNGKTLTLTGATVNNPGIMTRGSEQLTVIGKGTFNANGRIAVEANGTSSIINLSGSTGFFGAEPTYVTDRSGGELIYCYLGTINIYAGIFKNEGADKKFLLNCYDANYRSGKANIIVMGGKFYDFDPANNTAEGEGTSFVPDGYESVHTTEEIDGIVHDVYTVKKSA